MAGEHIVRRLITSKAVYSMKGETKMDFLRNFFGKKQPAETPSSKEITTATVNPFTTDAVLSPEPGPLRSAIGPANGLLLMHFGCSNGQDRNENNTRANQRLQPAVSRYL